MPIIKKFHRTFLLTLTTVMYSSVFAQHADLRAEEQKYAEMYSRLVSCSYGDWDSASPIADSFAIGFRSLISKDTATLRYSFPMFKTEPAIDVVTSDDGNFRMYSWDTWLGGTMHEFKAIFQWRDKGRIHMYMAKDEEESFGAYGVAIHTVNIAGSRYYLVVTGAIMSNHESMQSITGYAIRDSRLSDTAKIFKTKKERLSRIDVEYDYFSVEKRPERPIRLIRYDKKTKTLYVPVVEERGKVTQKNLVYHLKESGFEYSGVQSQ